MEKKNELVQLQKDEGGLVQRVKEMIISSVETLTDAVDLTKETKLMGKKIKELKDKILHHPKEQIKEINAEFKPAEDSLKVCESELKGKIITFQEAEEEKRIKEEERLRKEQEKKFKKETVKAEKKGDTPPPPPAPITISKSKVAGLVMKKTWDFEVVDVSKVPFELNGAKLLKVDSTAVRKLVGAGTREIPGIKIFQKSGASISSKEESVEDL